MNGSIWYIFWQNLQYIPKAFGRSATVGVEPHAVAQLSSARPVVPSPKHTMFRGGAMAAAAHNNMHMDGMHADTMMYM